MNTILPEFPNCDLRTFKIAVDSRTNVFKVGLSKLAMGVRTYDKIPKSLLAQLYVQPASKSAELAYLKGKKYEPSSGYLVMENEAIPAMTSFTGSRSKTFKVATFFYVDSYQTEYGITHSDFIDGINYLYKTMVNNDRLEDKFYLFALDNTGVMIKVNSEINIPKEYLKK